jgi:hypothetical protein
MATMANLFNRLAQGRPQQAKKTTERRPKNNTGLVSQWAKDEKTKTFLTNLLTKGAVPAATIEKRGAAHKLSKQQLWRIKQQMGVVAFKQGFGIQGRWFWTFPQNIPATINPRSRFTRRLRNLAKSRGYRLQPIDRRAAQR